MRYRLRTLFALVTLCAVAVGVIRALPAEAGPIFGLYLIGLASICAGIAAAILPLFDPLDDLPR